MINRRSLRVKVLQLLFSYYNQISLRKDKGDAQLKISNQLEESICSIEKGYYDIFTLCIIFKEINEEKRIISKSELIKKSQSRFNLSKNRVICFIQKNSEIIDGQIKYDNKWTLKNEKIRAWYNLLLKEDFYIDYIKINKPNFEEDLDFFQNLILKFLFKNVDVMHFFEEGNIFWSEDFLVVRSMIKKTLKSLNSTNFNKFAVASLSDDLGDDVKFARSLFNCVIDNSYDYDNYITKFAKNWDLERVSSMDKIILKMGIGEMTHFSNIPLKVTINECIDIAKNYSSPKSSKFINGLLDVISLSLLKENKINKSGKGLIDNK